MKRTLKLALLAFVVFATTSFGAVVLDFGTGLAGTGGTYTLVGSNATGSNIPIGSLTVAGVGGGFDGVYLVSAVLNFDTGVNSNFINIIGSVGACATPATCDSNNLGIPSGTTLLNGTISSFTADVNGLHNATGPDTKDPGLLAALGLPTNLQFSVFGFSLTTNQRNPDSVISTDMRNTAVPEPASVALLGGVVFLAAHTLRRKFQARA